MNKRSKRSLKKAIVTGLAGLVFLFSGCSSMGVLPPEMTYQTVQTDEEFKEIYDKIKPDLDYLIENYGYDLAMRLSEETLFRDRINHKPKESLTYYVDYSYLRNIGLSEDDINKIKKKEQWIIYEVIPKGIPYPELYPKLTENKDEADIIVKLTYLDDPMLKGAAGTAYPSFDSEGYTIGGEAYVLAEFYKKFPAGMYKVLIEEQVQLLIRQRDYTGDAPVVLMASDLQAFEGEEKHNLWVYLSDVGLTDVDIHLERMAYKLPVLFNHNDWNIMKSKFFDKNS